MQPTHTTHSPASLAQPAPGFTNILPIRSSFAIATKVRVCRRPGEREAQQPATWVCVSGPSGLFCSCCLLPYFAFALLPYAGLLLAVRVLPLDSRRQRASHWPGQSYLCVGRGRAVASVSRCAAIASRQCGRDLLPVHPAAQAARDRWQTVCTMRVLSRPALYYYVHLFCLACQGCSCGQRRPLSARQHVKAGATVDKTGGKKTFKAVPGLLTCARNGCRVAKKSFIQSSSSTEKTRQRNKTQHAQTAQPTPPHTLYRPLRPTRTRTCGKPKRRKTLSTERRICCLRVGSQPAPSPTSSRALSVIRHACGPCGLGVFWASTGKD